MRIIGTILSIMLAALGGGIAHAQDHALQLKLGVAANRGDGEFWAATEEAFTLAAGDFDDLALGLTWTSGIGSHFDVGFNVDLYDSTVRAGYRDLGDQDGYPILHDSRLRMVPVSVDFRILPFGRGIRRDRAGIPRERSPLVYFGGGVGLNVYRYEEFGDFVNFDHPDWPVVEDAFRDDGVAPLATAVAGVEIPMGDILGLVFEGRYRWSKVDPGDDFRGLGSLDLSGPSAYVGLSLRF